MVQVVRNMVLLPRSEASRNGQAAIQDQGERLSGVCPWKYLSLLSLLSICSKMHMSAMQGRRGVLVSVNCLFTSVTLNYRILPFKYIKNG